MPASTAPYELYYWPTIQGRGEFIRLALEAAGADYIDVARRAESSGMGMAAMLRMLDDADEAFPPFAPPFLKAGDLLLAQTPNILQYLGPRLQLIAADEPSRLWAHQLQLTIADWLTEVHDTHHPLAGGLYYEDQQQAALQRAAHFTAQRLPKFLNYFEQILARNPDGDTYSIGATLSYVDLSLFQMIAGLRHAFPRALQRLQTEAPRLLALHQRVAKEPRIAAYLASKRRVPFNQQGIFRHYPELDG